ncbi:EpsG family protein [Chitinophaga rhizophila]|uniref:EpsG family protein n=1 Tax=Chitinophaga rhizophila TaxID=2866212 RepID=A0ABS7GIZ9_9BACT|nr:EpsG family protein [Chitinophaga rhizophila]MBW8686443.1 EpsG family protein [Chitinophaga rhizophila]
MAYVLVFLLFAVFGCYNLTEQYRQNKESQAFMYVIAFIVLVCFAGLRYHTGADWPNYEYHFNYILPKVHKFFEFKYTYFDPVAFEMGYVYLTSIVKSLGGEMTAVFFIAALLNIIGAFLLIRQFSPYPFVAMLGFYSYNYMQYNFAGVRQAVAFFFLALAVKYLYTRNFWKYTMFIILGYFFHSSIVVFVFLYFIPLQKETNIKLVLIALFLAFMMNVLFPINELIPIMSRLGLLPEFVNNKLLSYLHRDDYARARGFGIGFMLKFLILVVGIKYRHYLRENTPYFDFVFNLFCMYFFIWIITNSFEVLVARYSLYFQIFQDIILSYFLLVIPARKAMRLVFFAVLLVGVNFYFMSGLYKGKVKEEYNPYKNYLFHKWPVESN